MELDILYWIQNFRTIILDQIMVGVFNDFVGDKGQIWVILGIILLLIPLTRKTGVCVLASYLIAYFIGDGILKDLIARPRPCMVNETVKLLINRPTSFSCPSVHCMLAFASATAVFCFHKKGGIFLLVFACMIGFSRMYFFVHYPTDVLLGAMLGITIGAVVSYLIIKDDERMEKKNS